MYCVQNRIYCNDCSNYFIDENYTIHLRSQGHIDIVRKHHFTSSKNNSMMVKTPLINNK